MPRSNEVNLAMWQRFAVQQKGKSNHVHARAQ